MESDFKYDLAISLCDEDASLGYKICEELGNMESIFFYKKDVDSLTFKNGLNVFGDVFALQARFVLVLFRDLYGSTDWTAIEYSVIQDRYKKTIKSANSPILFCKLENAKLPTWLSETYIYSKYKSEKDLPSLISLIRKNILDHGGISFPKSIDEKLNSHYLEKKYNESYERRFMQDVDLSNESQLEAKALIDLLYERLKSASKTNNLNFFEDQTVKGAQLPEIRIVLETVFIIARYEKKYQNSLNGSNLYIEIFTTPQKRGIIFGDLFSGHYRERKTIQRFDMKYYITSKGIKGWRTESNKFNSTTNLVEIVFNYAASYMMGNEN